MVDIPKKIFIIPYRNREEHKLHFQIYMKHILEDEEEDSYKIFFVHQNDNRPFNRGAMKNIGFLVIKDIFPMDYKNITIVFNDIDTLPYKKNLLNYETKKGVVKHFYGFNFALGGIVSITAGDFEEIGGFCNSWGWGLEDNLLNKRAIDKNLTIDRSNFFKILDPNIIHVNDNIKKILSKQETWRYADKDSDSVFDIKNLNYRISNEFIHVDWFDSKFSAANETYYSETNRTKIYKDKRFDPNRRSRMNSLNFFMK